MKIQDPNTIPGTQSTGVEQAKRAESAVRIGSGGRSGSAAGTPGTDQVELSGLGGKLAELAADEPTPERTARLDALQKLVASGQYQVGSKELATRIIDDSIAG